MRLDLDFKFPDGLLSSLKPPIAPTGPLTKPLSVFDIELVTACLQPYQIRGHIRGTFNQAGLHAACHRCRSASHSREPMRHRQQTLLGSSDKHSSRHCDKHSPQHWANITHIFRLDFWGRNGDSGRKGTVPVTGRQAGRCWYVVSCIRCRVWVSGYVNDKTEPATIKETRDR